MGTIVQVLEAKRTLADFQLDPVFKIRTIRQPLLSSHSPFSLFIFYLLKLPLVRAQKTRFCLENDDMSNGAGLFNHAVLLWLYCAAQGWRRMLEVYVWVCMYQCRLKTQV